MATTKKTTKKVNYEDMDPDTIVNMRYCEAIAKQRGDPFPYSVPKNTKKKTTTKKK